MVRKEEQLVYEKVVERDRFMTWVKQEAFKVPLTMTLRGWLAMNPWVCVAPLLGASDRCSGEMERDHVWEHAGGTKGVRPPTTMETVAILCSHHHRDGWATSHRGEIREYIKKANEEWLGIRTDPEEAHERH